MNLQGRAAMKKSLMIWMMTSIAGVFMLAACTGGSTPAPELSATTKPTRTPRPTRTVTPITEIAEAPTKTPLSEDVITSELKGISVELWHPWTSNREFAILSLVNQFNAINEYGIVVTTFSQDGDLYTNVRNSLGSDKAPNLVAGYNNQLQSWDNQGGMIMDMDAYVNDPVWGFDEDTKADFFPVFWEQDTNQKKRLGLPVYRSAAVIFYNQTWARELGFDAPPQTIAEFEEQACAASSANNDSTGGLIAATDISSNMGWLFGFGGDLLHPNGAQYQADSPENQSAFTFLIDMKESGCAWTPDAYYPNQEFATRKALFYPSSIVGIFFQVNAFEEVENFDEWIVLPFPGDTGQPVINAYGPAYAIFETTPEEQLASWLFIQWMLEPQNQAQFIEASGYLPVRASTLTFLESYMTENPFWAQAVELIPFTKTEPALGSWGIGRYVFGDAIKELYAPDFSRDQIPSLLTKLETILNETHANNP
jgi:ABC-type glycerol-3-phosphate transport system substrate-binding protein